ncbi:unnamed protein product [Symbiodinium natans]|uniref:Uncharacterized protein n=1 Tax=Symbiodinium natans TaxID=878477 RepID=A0A812NVJ4_9DINO|nr:unnamed protein product [Symbiodinium natans]
MPPNTAQVRVTGQDPRCPRRVLKKSAARSEAQDDMRQAARAIFFSVSKPSITELRRNGWMAMSRTLKPSGSRPERAIFKQVRVVAQRCHMLLLADSIPGFRRRSIHNAAGVRGVQVQSEQPCAVRETQTLPSRDSQGLVAICSVPRSGRFRSHRACCLAWTLIVGWTCFSKAREDSDRAGVLEARLL